MEAIKSSYLGHWNWIKLELNYLTLLWYLKDEVSKNLIFYY